MDGLEVFSYIGSLHNEYLEICLRKSFEDVFKKIKKDSDADDNVATELWVGRFLDREIKDVAGESIETLTRSRDVEGESECARHVGEVGDATRPSRRSDVDDEIECTTVSDTSLSSFFK